MEQPGTEVIQGTLDLLILQTLSLEPLHGFGVARRIEQITNGVFRINPGSLLTAFQRLEREGWIDSAWRTSDNARRAKYYTLTRRGRKQLEAERSLWKRKATAIEKLLEAGA
jgi:transcriptional regulator